MDQVNPEGAVAPVETQVTPTAPPNGVPPVEAAKPADPPKPPEEKEPSGVAKRIKELTDARRAAEAREARLLALLEQQRQAPPPQARDSDEEPEKELKDFNYDEKAYRRYERERATAHAEKAAMEVAERYRVQQEAIGRRAKFDERWQSFAKTVDDFDDVVRWKNDPRGETPISEGMADYLMDSDEPGPLLYYLGNNSEEASKISRMSPAKAGRELTRLEDRLVAERKKAAEKPVSQAPPPAPKIEATTSSQALKSTDPEAVNLSGSEWRKLRDKELAALKKKRGG